MVLKKRSEESIISKNRTSILTAVAAAAVVVVVVMNDASIEWDIKWPNKHRAFRMFARYTLHVYAMVCSLLALDML